MPRKFTDYIRNATPSKPSGGKVVDVRPDLTKARPKGFGVSEGGGAEYQASPYDFESIDKAIDVDSYGKRSFNRMTHLAFKEGYDLKSANPEAAAYIEARFKLMAITQRQSMHDLFIEAFRNEWRYHNSFLIKTRDSKAAAIANSLGVPINPTAWGDPVAGYLCAPINTMSIKTDDRNVQIKGYKQTSGSNEAKFKPEDVIHLSVDRESGTVWGKPFLTSVIEDLRSFRIIEEDALNLVHKEMYPLYFYKVGDENHPADEEDLRKAVQALEDMYEDGAIAMPGKDDIGVVGSKEKSLDVTPHVKHFKERAIVGLGVSPHQIGVGSDLNKAGAEQIDKALYDMIKYYQTKLEEMINNEIIFELLLEGGFDPLGIKSDSSDMVKLEFREVDIEAQIKRENHIVTQFESNSITHGEMREKLGLPVDPELKDLYFSDIQMQIAEATAAAAAKYAVQAPSTNSGGANKSGKTSQTPAKGKAKSKDQPSNQKGNRGTPKVKA